MKTKDPMMKKVDSEHRLTKTVVVVVVWCLKRRRWSDVVTEKSETSTLKREKLNKNSFEKKYSPFSTYSVKVLSAPNYFQSYISVNLIYLIFLPLNDSQTQNKAL